MKTWRRKWQPTPVFLPGKSHGQRSLVGYSPWGCKESDTTEWLHLNLIYEKDRIWYISLWKEYLNIYIYYVSVQFSSFAQSCLTLCDPMNCSTPGFPVHHQFPELTQTHVHGVSNAIQPSHPLLSPSPPALNLSQHQGLFKRVSSSHQVAKVLEFQLQHQSFQWTPRTDLL